MMQADDPMAAFAQPPPPQQQPQHPPPVASSSSRPTQPPAMTANNSSGNNTNLPYSIYDVILDIPHPGASSSSDTPIQIFYPPSSNPNNEIVDTISLQELTAEFGPENNNNAGGSSSSISSMGAAKVARFAFPEYDDAINAQEMAQYQQTKSTLGWKDCNSGNLNKHDGYLEGIYSVTSPAEGGDRASPGSSGAAAVAGMAGSNGVNYSGNSSTNNNAATTQLITLPSHHVFAHQLSNGSVVHGHVRRYLPYHADTNGTRRDVGRRSVRALVILTRNSGGGNQIYNGILKSMEMIILQQQGGDLGRGQKTNVANTSENSSHSSDNSLRHFLHSLHQEHVNLCRSVGSALSSGKQTKVLARPWILTLPLVELGRGHGLFGSVDVVKFAVPPSFLHGRGMTSNVANNGAEQIAGLSRNDMMPMLRCLGVPRTLRLLSALMSERRVILTSNNVSKLSAVSYGALAMMAQGLLNPPADFFPVLPPGLLSQLQSPSAYLIGVLTGPTPNYVNLRNVPNIGEVVLFDLDNQQGNEPYFHNIANPGTDVPDLTRRNVDDMDMASARMVSIADVLYQELTECTKSDKKLFWQGAVQEKLGAAAAKGKKVASAAMKKGLKYLKNKSGKSSNKDLDSERTVNTARSESAGDVDDDLEEENEQQGDGSGSGSAILSKLVGKGNYAYEHGYFNETSEMDARIALSTFFVSLYGDITTYMTQTTPGQSPVPDKNKFMKYRADNGDRPGSGMFVLIAKFLSSKLFDSFAAARLVEVQMRRPVPEDAPLFALTTNHHRLNKINFAMNNIRQSVRHIATNEYPTRYLVEWNTKMRDRVSALTSTQTFNGDWGKTVSQLTEDCHECSTILIDAIMVLWTRMQEGRGMQWKKSLLALQIFRNLLLNGPINAVAEAIDGFASIRILKSYTEAMRGQNSKLVRDVAIEVYSLIVDLPVLFARRRECMNRLRLKRDPQPSLLKKETRMVRGISQFRNVHIASKPAGATVAPAPTPVTDLLNQGAAPAGPTGVPTPTNAPASAPQSGIYSTDLLSMSVAVTPSPQVAVNNAGVGGQSIPSSSVPQSGNYSNDLLALSFGASPSPQVGAPAANSTAAVDQKAPDPFSMQAMSQATPTAGPPATANIPLSQSTPMQPTPIIASFPMTCTAPVAVAPQPPSQSIQHAQHQKPMTNQSPTTTQPRQAQPQFPPMNSSFFTMHNAPPVPPSQPMQQMQRQPSSQTTMTPPIMNQPLAFVPPMQGGNFPLNYQQPPQQQPWNNPAAGFVPNNGYQANRSMPPPQNTVYGMGQGNSAAAPTTAGVGGYPMMQQAAPQFQQGATMQQLAMGSTPAVPQQNIMNANMQKK